MVTLRDLSITILKDMLTSTLVAWGQPLQLGNLFDTGILPGLRLLSVILLAVLIILPWFIAKTYFLGISVYLLNLILIHCLVAIGLNILVGYTGQISLGHAGFFAIGAFTTVMFVSRMESCLLMLTSIGLWETTQWP